MLSERCVRCGLRYDRQRARSLQLHIIAARDSLARKAHLKANKLFFVYQSLSAPLLKSCRKWQSELLLPLLVLCYFFFISHFYLSWLWHDWLIYFCAAVRWTAFLIFTWLIKACYGRSRWNENWNIFARRCVTNLIITIFLNRFLNFFQIIFEFQKDR
jgi:hypothetical protein